MTRRRPIRGKDLILVAAISAIFAPATVLPYIRKKAIEDQAVLDRRKLRDAAASTL